MNQITIRGIPADVERAIRDESKQSQLSLNKTIINMLKRAADAAKPAGKKQSGGTHNLLKYANTWTKEEADEFDRIIEETCEQIDEEAWK